jgi:glycosyltransferase involved in cell wall biosynthesis
MLYEPNSNYAMNALRIAMLTTFYPPFSFGGDALGVQRLARALARKGHNVTVIHDIDAYHTLSTSTPSLIEAEDDIEVVGLSSRVGYLSSVLTHQLGRPVIHGANLEKILAPGAHDIIWFHNISLVGGPGLLSYGDGLKIYEAHEHWLVCPSHVLWRHNRELCDGRQCLRCVLHYRRPPQVWRYFGLLDRQLKNVDTFIAKSEFSRRKHKEFGFPRAMQVVPYFLPEAAVSDSRDSGTPHDRPYFLFVGRLEKIKGLDEVIGAFTNYPAADLLIVGSGEYEDELRKQAKGISNIHFVGRLVPDALSRYYRNAIALIVPSVCFETFGIILIESFRQGTPVIARDIGPFGEIVNRCDGGLLFSDSEGLLSSMSRLQGEPAYRENMAKSAKTGFERFWSEQIVLDQYLKALHQAALDAGRSRLASDIEENIQQ